MTDRKTFGTCPPDLPANLISDLEDALTFAEAAAEACEITEQTCEIRRAELREATAAARTAEDSHDAAIHDLELGDAKLAGLLRANGLVRTADGIARAVPQYHDHGPGRVCDAECAPVS
jgi:hypothetical protein